jgi:hypothetical protein
MNWIVEQPKYENGYLIINAYPEGEPENNITINERLSESEAKECWRWEANLRTLGNKIATYYINQEFKIT